MLGIGGQGICFLAVDQDLNRSVVIKLYREGMTDLRRRQILDEGRAIAKIRSPHIARCYGADYFKDRPYLILEYIEGDSLLDWVEGRCIDSVTAIDIIRQLATGVESVHNNSLLHLDVKPGNVVVDNDCNAVLIDFGLSQSTFDKKPANIAGSPSFLAPEWFSSREIDQRTDIYGLGAILFFLMTGEAPFEGQSKSSVVRKVLREEVDFAPLKASGASMQVEEICRRCLAVDPDERIGTIAELLSLIHI